MCIMCIVISIICIVKCLNIFFIFYFNNTLYMDENKITDSINKLFSNLTDNFIFIYTPPKVGSTTLVTSLRISLGKIYNIIHIHDETMLSVLTGINDIKINDIINYLSKKGKNVNVIDIYRTPIENKMSVFFEKISPYHFNNSETNISNYSIERISDRFNNIFPHIVTCDNYLDKYDINEPIPFHFEKKYTIQIINNIKYIKLRLCDVNLWASILTDIFKLEIVIINDYKTEDKGIGELYKKFKNNYKIPINYIENIKECKYFNYYNNEIERNRYLRHWSKEKTNEYIPYTSNEYKFYINLCLQNQYINDVQLEHYIDNGCFCKCCSLKRKELFYKAKSGEKTFDKMNHSELVNNYQLTKIKNIKENIKTVLSNSKIKQQQTSKFTIKNFLKK